MKVEKFTPEVVYKVELSAQAYNDISTALYWIRDNVDFGSEWRKRINNLYGVMNANG